MKIVGLVVHISELLPAAHLSCWHRIYRDLETSLLLAGLIHGAISLFHVFQRHTKSHSGLYVCSLDRICAVHIHFTESLGHSGKHAVFAWDVAISTCAMYMFLLKRSTHVLALIAGNVCGGSFGYGV